MTFMLNAQAAKEACHKCGKSFDPNGMIHETGRINGETIIDRPCCLGCWNAQGSKPATVTAEPPKPRDPRDAFSRTTWKTYAEAVERHAKVMAYLGVMPDIWPREPSQPGPFTVCPDSPLVPGFPKAR